jgi:hypothetical protein
MGSALGVTNPPSSQCDLVPSAFMDVYARAGMINNLVSFFSLVSVYIIELLNLLRYTD